MLSRCWAAVVVRDKPEEVGAMPAIQTHTDTSGDKQGTRNTRSRGNMENTRENIRDTDKAMILFKP